MLYKLLSKKNCHRNLYHVIQSHSTIKSRYGSLWDWKYFHVVGNHVIENHVKQGMTVHTIISQAD